METSFDERQKVLEQHLDWSDKQRRILTADGKAEAYYRKERGFSFDETELPHYHLISSPSATRLVFREWKMADAESCKESPIVGAWKRPLFSGAWEHSTERDEHVFNLQTESLFIDLRIPVTRNILLRSTNARSLDQMNAEQLRIYARQHIFAGYSRLNWSEKKGPWDLCCTRHHCIDWNFVGTGRNRPNKWWIERHPNSDNVWKEWAYAADNAGQQYYFERWERLEGGERGPVVALRKADGLDGVLVIVGDHFSYCLQRQLTGQEMDYLDATSLVSKVDAALDQNHLETARAWLSTQGGHGRVSKGWLLDCAIEFWKEGTPLWRKEDVLVEGTDIRNARVIWKGEVWDIFECDLTTVDDLREVLWTGLSTC